MTEFICGEQLVAALLLATGGWGLLSEGSHINRQRWIGWCGWTIALAATLITVSTGLWQSGDVASEDAFALASLSFLSISVIATVLIDKSASGFLCKIAWFGGLLLVVATASSVWLMLGAALTIFNTDFLWSLRRKLVRKNVPADVISGFGSILILAGVVAIEMQPGQLSQQIGIVLLIVGLGTGLNVFPFPVSLSMVSTKSNLFGNALITLIPIWAGAILMFRITRMAHWEEAELSVIAVVMLYSLLLCGLQLMRPQSASQWLSLSAMTIFPNASLAIILAAWTNSHAELDWSATSNLPTGTGLLLSILLVESMGILLVSSVLREVDNPLDQHPDQQEQQVPDPGQRTVGILFRVPMAVGWLSLTGLPPGPGAWWRLGLIAAIVLAHRRSILTNLAEPHRGFLCLAVAFIATWLVVTLGHFHHARSLNTNSIALVASEGRTLSSSSASWLLLGVLVLTGYWSLSVEKILARLLQ